MGKFFLEYVPTAEELARLAAGQWLDQLANERKTHYFVALSGGRISTQFFKAVVARARARSVSLASVHFFWADERCVAPDHSESNYRVAAENLFGPLAIPQDHIHRIPGENPPAKAAQLASDEIRTTVKTGTAGCPELDMVFLGMGEDGHVASLFPPPRHPSGPDPYIPVVAAKPPPHRVTLQYEVIVAARQVFVLASGAGKQTALRDSILKEGQTPLAEVIRLRSECKIFTDILPAT